MFLESVFLLKKERISKLFVHKKSGLLFCLTLVQWLKSDFSRGSGSGFGSGKWRKLYYSFMTSDDSTE